jgi:flagellar motor switch/type III secretory pathway protein FliN
MLLYRFWSPFCRVSGHMATTHPMPAPVSEHPGQESKAARGNAGGNDAAVEQALIPSPQPVEDDPTGLTPPLGRLPVELEVAVPAREFRVRNLLVLELGQVIETQWAHGEDLPLAAGNVQLAWSEFEVVDAQLAVRVTRLA